MSKYVLISIILLLLASTAYAGEYAIDKGSTILSGMMSFSNSSGGLYEDEEGNSLTTFTIAPSLASFVVSNLALGAQFSFSHASQGHASISGMSIGPKIAYFFGSAASKSYPYLGMGFAFLTDTFRQSRGYLSYGESGYTVSGTKFYFSAGVAIMAAPNLAVVCEGFYNIDKLRLEHVESVSGHTFALSIGLAGFLF